MIILKLDHSALREELRLAERALKVHFIRDAFFFGGAAVTILGLLAMGSVTILLSIAGVAGWIPSTGLFLILMAIFVFLVVVLLAGFISKGSMSVIQRADRARNALDRATFVEERPTHVSS